jgi:hypothetical protein
VNYVSQGYTDQINYKDTQPVDQRKKGFGTRDAHKRDEFSNVIATERYRETLRKEKLLTAESPEAINVKLTKLLADRAAADSNSTLSLTHSNSFRTQKVTQYDIGRNRTTDFNPKAIKDTFYRFNDDQGREFGSSNYKPVNTDIGADAWNVQYKPPSFGGKSEVKNFYDKSHLNVSSH